MPSLDAKLASLRRKAAADDVEVEHLTAFAAAGDARAVPVIRELQREHGWPHSNRQGKSLVVPLGRWADVVCVYLEGGCDALVAYARRREPDSFDFAASVLEELKSAAAVGAMAELARGLVKRLPERLGDGVRLASAINLALSFKKPPAMDPVTCGELRSFLHRLLSNELPQEARASVVCALRGVGDEESIRIIDGLPKFHGPWAGLEAIASKAIRKRLHRTRGAGA
jgi:hypothetical protein